MVKESQEWFGAAQRMVNDYIWFDHAWGQILWDGEVLVNSDEVQGIVTNNPVTPWLWYIYKIASFHR